MFERDCLTWGFVTIGNLLKIIFKKKPLLNYKFTNWLKKHSHTHIASRTDLHVCGANAQTNTLGETERPSGEPRGKSGGFLLKANACTTAWG